MSRATRSFLLGAAVALACVLALTLAGFVTHSHRERNHQGLRNEPIDDVRQTRDGSGIHRRQRLGGLFNYYYYRAT
jgi:hypothetical protein